MADANELESPPSEEAVFLAVADVEEMRLRPLMTGDILELDDGKWVALIQHPCAMRSGPVMLDRLLACEVVPKSSGFRTKWSNEPLRSRPLRALDGGREVDFRLPVVLAAKRAAELKRVAIMERIGVNLLLQRWVNHNSRVVVATVTFDEQSAGPYAEVDLVYEGLTELTEHGWEQQAAEELIEDFLSSTVTDTNPHDTWRARLRHPQNHAPALRVLFGRITAALQSV